MKKSMILTTLTSLTLFFVFYSCKKNDSAADPCSGVNIQLTLTKTDPASGTSNGIIVAQAGSGSGFTYSLNNGAFQSSNTFSGLAAGTYSVTAKNSSGCSGTASITLTDVSNTDSCINSNISISNNVTDLIPCSGNNGSISVNATGANIVGYSKDGGASYQTSNVFSSLAVGNYNIKVKDDAGCVANASASVGTQPRGTNFDKVRNIVLSKCGGGDCHLNGQSNNGYNYDNECSIVNGWNMMNKVINKQTGVRAMPPSGASQLSPTELYDFNAWISTGHKYNN